MELIIIVPSFYPATQFGGPIYSLKDFVEEAACQDIKTQIYTTNAGIKGKVSTNQNTFFNDNPKIKITYFSGFGCGKKYISIPLIMRLPKILFASKLVKMEDLFSIYVPITFIIGSFFKKTIICSPRGVLSKQALKKNRFLKLFYIYLVIKPFSRRIIWHSTSELEKKQIFEIFGSKNILTIPNGIRQNRLQQYKTNYEDPVIRRGQKIFSRMSKKVIGLGRYDPHKQFEILIEAFEYLNPSDYELILAGPGIEENLYPSIENRTEKRNLHFFNNLNEEQKWFFLEKSDVLVLPSKSENFGNVIIEALASGTPVVTSDQTPWTMINDEGIGRCLKVISPISLSDAIRETILISNNFTSRRCKEFASKYYLNHLVTKFKSTFENSY